MSFRHLKSLFNPRSIAVIGASARERRMGNVLMRNLLSGQFAGPIMPVNPRRTSVAGVLTYPSIAALPQTPDLAIICTPAPLVPRLVEELGERGARAVMVMANQLDTTLGADGRPIERSILEITRRYEMRLLGGGTLGILVPGLGLNATFSQIAARPGKLGFVSQRDTVGTMVLDWALRKKVGFSHFVSLGDSLDIGFGEVLDFLAADSGTRAILLYIESIQDRRAFMSAARAAARNKPVIAIKAGRSPDNPLMGVSDPLFLEMPNLVSHDDVHDAALRRAGILRVDQLEEMFGAAETVLRARPLRGNRLVVLSNGGGAGLMVEDSLYLAGYSLPALKEQTIERLRRFMSPAWNGRNPLEIRVDSEPACYERLLKILQEERDGDAVLLIHTPNALSSSIDTAQQVIATARETGINLMTCWVGDESVEKERNLFINAGIATFDSPEHAASAFLHMHRHRIASEVLMEVPTSEPEAFKPDAARARAAIQGALAQSRASLTESESKDVLAAYGVPVIQTHLAATPEEAAQIAGRIGLPVALTLMSRDIRRKWDVGGVALNLESTEAVQVAARGMIERAGRAEPPVSVSGFTVQRMVMRGHARQLLIGVSTDRLFGPVIVFGEGGRALEIFRGLAVGLPPLNKPLADDLITRSKAAALLEARGHLPAADRDALALTLTKISQIVVDHPEIHEMDINPVFVDEHGVQALDAHMRLRPATAHEHRLAIQPYPKALEEPSRLRDGRPILLRPIRPEDEPAHYAFLSRLTREDFIYRFFNYIPEFPRREMARLTQIDYDREMAFIATATGPDGKPETLGVSRAVADPDNHTAEFALVIRSDLKRQRLGSILMDKLVRYAREIGIQRLVGEVMGENEPMLGLLKHLGFKLKASEEPGVVRAIFELRPPSEG